MTRTIIPVIALASLIAVSPAAQQRQSPEALALALQERYEGIRDFSADFVQTYRGGVLRTQTSERGTVSVKKPGMMRWTYTQPEPREFVSDGLQLYTYLPAEKRVVVSDVPEGDRATSGAMFLAGRGDVARDFTAEYVEPSAAGTVALKLTPRRSEPDYEYLIVAVDPATLQIRSLTTRDRQGGDSTLTFSNMKENQGLSDNLFAFRVPRGVDVVTNGSRN